MKSAPDTLQQAVKKDVLLALEHIEIAYEALAYAIENEMDLHPTELNDFYNYGLDAAEIHKVKLANIKKSILSITEKKPSKRGASDAVYEMSLSALSCSQDMV